MPRFGFPDVVDAVTLRLVAALVLVLSTAAFVTGRWWLYAVLAIDFALRSAFGPSASPLAQVALRLRPPLGALPQPTAGAPKRFAATIGAVLTAAAFLLGAAGSIGGPAGGSAGGSAGATTVAFALGTIMVVFPALEALAGICAGCLFYSRLMRVGLVPPESCLDCTG